MTVKGRLTLLMPAIWTCIVDVALTTIHQPEEYWTGNLDAGNEANPIGRLFMRNHVSGFFIISAAWLILIVVLGYYLPRAISRIFLLFVVLAHSVGASTWLLNRYGYWSVIIFVLFNAILFCVVEDRVVAMANGKRELNGGE